MAELRDSSGMMRQLALAATLYVAGTQVLYVLTKGAQTTPDRWENFYLALLAAYAAAPEVKILAQGSPESPNGWNEKIRKGGPVIAFWASLLMGIGALRLWDASFPMPPEIEPITLKTIGLFFGTYALRQYGRGRARKQASESDAASSEETTVDPDLRARIVKALTLKPQGLSALAETLSIAPRTLTRHLKQLTRDGTLQRDAQSPTDPQAVYRAP